MPTSKSLFRRLCVESRNYAGAAPLRVHHVGNGLGLVLSDAEASRVPNANVFHAACALAEGGTPPPPLSLSVCMIDRSAASKQFAQCGRLCAICAPI